MNVSVADVVCITWVDSAGQNGRWQFASEIQGNMKATHVRSYGIVVETTTEHVLIVPHCGEPSTKDDDELQYQGAFVIPLCCIKEIIHLVPREGTLQQKCENTHSPQ